MLLGRYLQLIKTFHVASKNDFILGLLSNVKRRFGFLKKILNSNQDILIERARTRKKKTENKTIVID